MNCEIAPAGQLDWGLYVHVPFCQGKCPYCDFYSKPIRDAVPLEYTDGIVAEYHLLMGENRSESAPFPEGLLQASPRTVYFGGGTPSLLSVEEVARLLGLFLGARRGDQSVTLECNPDSVSPEYFQGIRSAGINRISIGIQSLNDDVLRILGRRHTAAKAKAAVRAAREAGFADVTVDLIYGIPGLEEDVLLETLEAFVALEVTHISAYHLTIEPRTGFGRRVALGKMREVEERVSERHFSLVHRYLTDCGFDHYEVSNFARDGHYAEHNRRYWDGTSYLGLGPSAHSFVGGKRWWNVEDYSGWADAVHRGGLPIEVEALSLSNRFDEWVMTGLRTRWGLNIGNGNLQFGNQRVNRLLSRAKTWIRSGQLRYEGGRLFLRPEDFLLSDAVILDLVS